METVENYRSPVASLMTVTQAQSLFSLEIPPQDRPETLTLRLVVHYLAIGRILEGRSRSTLETRTDQIHLEGTSKLEQDQE